MGINTSSISIGDEFEEALTFGDEHEDVNDGVQKNDSKNAELMFCKINELTLNL